jgi:hypothetical protein
MYIAWIFKNKVYSEDCANIGDEIVNFIKNNYRFKRRIPRPKRTGMNAKYHLGLT